MQENPSRQAPEIVPTNSHESPSGIKVPLRPAKRQRLAQREFNRADRGGLHPTHWESWRLQLHQWQHQTSLLVSNMVGCAWCGKRCMGGQHSPHRVDMRKIGSDEVPPAAAANPIMAAYMTGDLASPDGESNRPTQYWACQTCCKNEKRRATQQHLHTPRYAHYCFPPWFVHIVTLSCTIP